MKLAPTFAALLLVAGAALPAQAQTPIAVGQTVRGSLAASDAKLGDDSYYDAYTLNGRSGQTVTVTLRSEAFDTYLAVGRMSGSTFESLGTDDDGAGGTDSRVVLTLPANGAYVIRANSLSAGSTGDYTLEVAAGGTPSPTPASSSGSDLLSMLVDSTTSLMAGQGFTPRGAALRGALAQGASTDVTVQLPAASTVMLVGVCDADCSNVDMVVFGPDGSKLGSDSLEDDAPMVRLDAVRAGSYRVRMTMTACSSAPCGFAVRAYGN